jgi:hypothetical protein
MNRTALWKMGMAALLLSARWGVAEAATPEPPKARMDEAHRSFF